MPFAAVPNANFLWVRQNLLKRTEY